MPTIPPCFSQDLRLPPKVVMIPGLNGHPGMLMREAPSLFGEWRPVAFNHHLDTAEGGVEGLAWRALELIPRGQQAYVCGESFGGTVALTMARVRPERIKGLVLLSSFGWHPSMLAHHVGRLIAAWAREPR